MSHLAKKPQVKCPTCGAKSEYSTDNPFRPFCSERCKLIDLGQWADESYKIADESATTNDPYSDDTPLLH